MTVSCFVTSQFTNKNVQLVEIATYGIEENPVLSSTYLSCTIHSTSGKLKACVQSPETVHLIFSVHLTVRARYCQRISVSPSVILSHSGVLFGRNNV